MKKLAPVGRVGMVLALAALLFLFSCNKTTAPGTVADPVFDPPAGDYAQDQMVSLSCATDGAEIRYTLDGSDPDDYSARYLSALLVELGKTVKARASKPGMVSSAIAGAFYSGITPTPQIGLESGDYEAGQPVIIIINNQGLNLESLFIRFTLDGSEPSDSSTVYQGQIMLTESCTVKARAFYLNWNPSPVVAAHYTVSIPTVQAPSIDPPSGYVQVPLTISISCPTADASIRFTQDGTEPNEGSNLYAGPILITETGQLTVKARAYKEYAYPSQVASESYTITWPPPEMVFVQGGSFNNGSSNVTLSSFYIAQFELTQAEYREVMGYNPSQSHGVGDIYPVYSVSWYDAIEYCNRRSSQEGRVPCYSYGAYGSDPDAWPAGWNQSAVNHTLLNCDWSANGYRLPTEMEWMFAAKGGNQSQGYTYSGSNDIASVAWYGSNAGNSTHIIGGKDTNELGTYDMSGNVYEWVWDIQAPYPAEDQFDPHGPDSGFFRVTRGGYYNSVANACTVTSRSSNNANVAYSLYGFRICRNSR
ncbi:MAG: chitobiase/beta-hexosaminidase C-terminal domain-containing protein [Candidatus Syntrophosphaera sp.]|nr:chitobiase/beta-hexosaminidase C-terminal domain-containing protein [Candidatus Syntrophosphaera sp.]